MDAALSKLNLDYLIVLNLMSTYSVLTDSLQLNSLTSINTTDFNIHNHHNRPPCLPQSSSSATPRPSTTKPISTPIKQSTIKEKQASSYPYPTGPFYPRPSSHRPWPPAMRPAAPQPRPALLVIRGQNRHCCEPDAADAADGESGGGLAG